MVILPQFPTPVAILTHIVLLWLIFLVEGTLIALSITRIFLILQVSLRSRKGAHNSHGCIQPTEFNQLDHERKFKLVLGALFSVATVYVLSLLGIAHLLKAGTYI